MANGNHLAHLTVTPAGHTPHTAELLLMLALPRIEHVAPYVTYVGQAAPVTFYGNRLDQTLGATLVINGIEVHGFAESMANRARITLPVLPVGEYTMHIKNNLGVVIPMSRFVVRQPPSYPDADVATPGRIESLEYDAERDAFYGVSYSELTGVFSAWRMRFDGAQWHTDTIDGAPGAESVAMNVDGTKLFVAGPNCIVREVNPATLQITQTAQRSSCFSEFWGLSLGLADGRILVGNNSQWPTVYEYPSFVDTTTPFPFISTPHYKLNRNRDRLLWAETPTISAPRHLFFYDLPTDTFSPIIVQDPDTYMFSWNIAISDDGHRMMHRRDVYEDGQYVGSVSASLTNAFISPALTHDGEHAVIFDPDTHVLALYDLGTGPNFPKIGDIDTLPDSTRAQTRIALLPDDSVAFTFTTLLGQNGVTGYSLYVRNLP
jgi:hypothetical protein